jgi:drug/metabolite transporter (DMT)-like permease
MFFGDIPALSATQIAVIAGVVLCFVCISFWAIWDAFSRDYDHPMEKFAWIQLAVLAPFVGGLIYAIIGRRRGRKRTPGGQA